VQQYVKKKIAQTVMAQKKWGISPAAFGPRTATDNQVDSHVHLLLLKCLNRKLALSNLLVSTDQETCKSIHAEKKTKILYTT
jgi:hypothetical protein